TVTSGSAALSGITDLAVGTHTVTATYTGNSAYAPSTGTRAGGQTVTTAGTATALGSSPNPVDVTQPVSFTVTVTATAPGAGIATGQVQIYADGSALGAPATLNGAGVASLPNITSLIPGTHPVTATYQGDGEPIPLSGGVAALDPVSNLAVGSHSVTATYTGVTRYAASTGSLPTQVVNQADTSVAVGSSVNPSTYGQGVDFSATVTVTAPG